MHTLTATARPTTRPSPRHAAARWTVTFLGFPAGGLLALLVIGPVDSFGAALAGGLVTGAVLGVVQAWGLDLDRARALHWVLATVLGLGVGLSIGATAVGYRTSLSALVIQGAISGLTVGAAQAVVLRRRYGRFVFMWPLALAATWATGWAVTTFGGIQVDDQFTVFGSSGALVVTALTTLLPVLINRNERRRAEGSRGESAAR